MADKTVTLNNISSSEAIIRRPPSWWTPPMFDLVCVHEKGGGKCSVTLKLSEWFVGWFKEKNGLSRWNAATFKNAALNDGWHPSVKHRFPKGVLPIVEENLTYGTWEYGMSCKC